MGLTVFYQGTLKDLGGIEEFESKVHDLILGMGGEVERWQTPEPPATGRIVRGLIARIAPKQDSASLLIGPEGWIVPLFDIEEVENGEITEAPMVFVKTQFGSIEGHVKLIELLTFLKEHFFRDFEVHDETGYWEHRDMQLLRNKFNQMSGLLGAFEQAVNDFPLSAEAAEDPEIVLSRMEQIGHRVHRTMKQPPKSGPTDLEGT